MLILVAVIAATSTYAAEFHVKLDGTGDFASIQEAIDASVDGDEIIVHPGTYYENVRFNGKNITLRSEDPTDWGAVEKTIIDGSRHRGSVARTEARSLDTSGHCCSPG